MRKHWSVGRAYPVAHWWRICLQWRSHKEHELGRSLGGGHGNLLRYSCLENPMGQRSLVGYRPQGRKKSWTPLSTNTLKCGIQVKHQLVWYRGPWWGTTSYPRKSLQTATRLPPSSLASLVLLSDHSPPRRHPPGAQQTLSLGLVSWCISWPGPWQALPSPAPEEGALGSASQPFHLLLHQTPKAERNDCWNHEASAVISACGPR